MDKINRKHKDRLFTFLFGSENNKELTLSLYNAINDTDYNDPDLIEFNTIDNFIYMGVRNDVSFIISDTMNVYEHQSTLSENLPFRMLIYLSKIYEPIVEASKISQYSEKVMILPKPKLVVFYNGTKYIEEERILLLSDMFGKDSDVEVKVRMLNINYGCNKKLMGKCQSLNEYASLIQKFRDNLKKGMNIFDAIDNAIIELREDSIIKPIIMNHRMEVVGMLFTMENEEREMQKYYNNLRDDAREEGLKEGREEGLKKGREEGLKEGREEGREEGLKVGREQGKEEERFRFVNSLRRILEKRGFSGDEIEVFVSEMTK